MMEKIPRIIVFLFAVVGCRAIPINEELLNGKYEYEFVNIDTKTVQSYSADKTYSIKTKAFGQDVDLYLKKMPSIFNKNFQFISLELDKNNKPVFKRENVKDHNEQVYRDGEKNSVLHVEYKNGELHLEGILTPELSIVHSSRLGFKNPSGNHAVVKTNFKKTFIDKVFTFKTPDRAAKSYSRVAAVNIPEVIRPEVLVVMDYKNSEKLEFDTPNIKKYLAIYWNAVNTRYELVENPRYAIELVGVVTTKVERLQPYIKLSRATVNGKDVIDIDKTLPYLNIFIYNNLDLLPHFDAAMLMTGEDMASADEDGTLNPNVAGVAYLGSACEINDAAHTVMNAGMAEDHVPYFNGYLNHAHELAHILGSVHDGDPPASYLRGHPGAEDCPWSDGYLMSYVFGTKNHLRFSECTIKQFKYLLSQPSASCLLEMTNDNHSIAFNSTLPGNIVSLDDQCRVYMGPEGLHVSKQDLTKICVILYCYHKGDERSVSRGPALEGSPCGYSPEMWCHDGECVSARSSS